MFHFHTIWPGHSKYETPRENLLMGIIYLEYLASFVESRVRRLFTLPRLLLFTLVLTSHPSLVFSPSFPYPLSPLFFSPFFFSPIVSTEIFIKPMKHFKHIKKYSKPYSRYYSLLKINKCSFYQYLV